MHATAPSRETLVPVGTWRRPDQDLRPAFRSVQVPTLVLHGSDV